MNLSFSYWTDRYKNNETQWDVGATSPPLGDYIDQLTNHQLKILIPGCGNAYEAFHLWTNGFKNVFLLDWSELPLKNFRTTVPDFPAKQLINLNFFEHEGTYDLILEQTFLSAIDPSQRLAYAAKMHQLLKPGGKLVGVLFNCTFENEGPPFGGSKEAYEELFSPYFDFLTWETCTNSIPAREGRELFMILRKK